MRLFLHLYHTILELEYFTLLKLTKGLNVMKRSEFKIFVYLPDMFNDLPCRWYFGPVFPMLVILSSYVPGPGVFSTFTGWGLSGL